MENSCIRSHFDRAVQNLLHAEKGDTIMLVLRHAESLGQKHREAYKILGDNDIPLTPYGSEQAAAAGVLLSMLIGHAGLKTVQLRSSTGRRSMQTADGIFRMLPEGIDIKSDTRLDKQKFGKFDGLFSAAERKAACPQEYPAFETDMEERGIYYARPPEGESIHDVQLRMLPFVREQEQNGGTTIAVTHGTNALCLEDTLLHRGANWITDRIDTRPNCAIRMIAGNPDRGYHAMTVCTNPVTYLQSLIKRGMPNIPDRRLSLT